MVYTLWENEHRTYFLLSFSFHHSFLSLSLPRETETTERERERGTEYINITETDGWTLNRHNKQQRMDFQVGFHFFFLPLSFYCLESSSSKREKEKEKYPCEIHFHVSWCQLISTPTYLIGLKSRKRKPSSLSLKENKK